MTLAVRGNQDWPEPSVHYGAVPESAKSPYITIMSNDQGQIWAESWAGHKSKMYETCMESIEIQDVNTVFALVECLAEIRINGF